MRTTTRLLTTVMVSAFALMANSANAQVFQTLAKQAIIVDGSSNTVLYEYNAEEQMHPSSMSKLMTIYIVFDHLKKGKLRLTDVFTVSEKAWRIQGSEMFLPINGTATIEELLRGVIIQSGNDACIALAEGIAGSEEVFAQEMNRKAKELGLTKSHFVNASGWPDPDHLMSAHDLATLSERLYRDFPEYYHYFKELEFTYNGIRQYNRNTLISKGVADGLKTGHTEDGGYGISISAERNGRRLFVVVNGLSSMAERIQESERLLEYGFRNFESIKLLAKDQQVDQAEVWFGEDDKVTLKAKSDTRVTLPRARQAGMKATVQYKGPIQAPIQEGAEIAQLVITMEGQPEIRVPLVAAKSVKKLAGLDHIVRALVMHFSGKSA